MINLKINNKKVEVEEGTTILEAAKKLEIRIPTLCYLKEINEIGACRICVVNIKGTNKLVASCVTPVSEGMEVLTDTPEVKKSRKKTLELILSTHNKDCENCIRNNNCELQHLFEEYDVNDNIYAGKNEDAIEDKSTAYLVRDNSKCILCNRCVNTCNLVQSVGVIGKNNRGFNTHIGCAFDEVLANVPCIACGQCINVCPTGALHEKDDTKEVFEALNDKNKYVVVATAPAVRVALGEEFGYPIGTNVKGKMVASLKKLKFDKVFDINFSADLTIMEETNEFINRLKKGKHLPLITSCSPGWIKYMEHYHPSIMKNVSTCKSPQQMYGAIIKTYFAKKNKLNPKDIFVVSVVPCVAKKFERTRNNQSASKYPDIDAVITTRELARMIKTSNIDFKKLNDEEFDNPFGSGASVVFGASGGVMEAALRTASAIIDEKELDKVDFLEVRGTKGIKEATYEIGGKKLNVAVVSGIKNAEKVLKDIENKKSKYHFVEIMTCPSGCINGGGQPIYDSETRNNLNVSELRIKAIYEEDKNLPVRKAHENEDIIELYDKYLKYPGSKLAHQLLHTSYEKRDLYK